MINCPNYTHCPIPHTHTDISKVSMAASNEKYGAGGNDRIFQNRL